MLTLDGLLGGPEAQTNGLVEAVAALARSLLLLALEAAGHAELLLECPLGLTKTKKRSLSAVIPYWFAAKLVQLCSDCIPVLPFLQHRWTEHRGLQRKERY